MKCVTLCEDILQPHPLLQMTNGILWTDFQWLLDELFQLQFLLVFLRWYPHNRTEVVCGMAEDNKCYRCPWNLPGQTEAVISLTHSLARSLGIARKPTKWNKKCICKVGDHHVSHWSEVRDTTSNCCKLNHNQDNQDGWQKHLLGSRLVLQKRQRKHKMSKRITYLNLLLNFKIWSFNCFCLDYQMNQVSNFGLYQGYKAISLQFQAYGVWGGKGPQ